MLQATRGNDGAEAEEVECVSFVLALNRCEELTLSTGLSILEKMIVLGYEEEAENICNRSAFSEHPLVKKVEPLTSRGTSCSGNLLSIAAREALLISLTTCRMVPDT